MPRLRGRSLLSVCGDGQDAPPTRVGLFPVHGGKASLSYGVRVVFFFKQF